MQRPTISGKCQSIESSSALCKRLSVRETLMAKHVFVVLTNPIDGQEDAYNDWYSNTHLADVLKIPGIIAAQRFKLSDVQRDAVLPFRYLALYEVETDDLSSTLAELKKRAG